jgi:hypothetical protein
VAKTLETPLSSIAGAISCRRKGFCIGQPTAASRIFGRFATCSLSEVSLVCIEHNSDQNADRQGNTPRAGAIPRALVA